MTALIYKAVLPTYSSAEALAANATETLVLNEAGTAYELEPAQGGASVTMFFGDDIPMESGWLEEDPLALNAAGAGPALTKVGDFVYASGRLVKPAGVNYTTTLAVIPVGWRPAASIRVPALFQDGVDFTVRATMILINQRDPATPTLPGSDSSGYGIIYLNPLTGVSSQPSSANKGYLYLSGVWRVEAE